LGHRLILRKFYDEDEGERGAGRKNEQERTTDKEGRTRRNDKKKKKKERECEGWKGYARKETSRDGDRQRKPKKIRTLNLHVPPSQRPIVGRAAFALLVVTTF